MPLAGAFLALQLEDGACCIPPRQQRAMCGAGMVGASVLPREKKPAPCHGRRGPAA
jgi:hypothetical protein